MKFRTVSRLNYLKRARHRGGFGIHSPFLFRLITTVIEDKRGNQAFKTFKLLRKQAIELLREMLVPELLKVFEEYNLTTAKPRKFYRKIELPLKYAKVVYRLIQDFQPMSITYFGPSLGVNLASMRMACTGSSVFQIVDNPIFQWFSKELLKDQSLPEIRYFPEDPSIPVNSGFYLINYPLNPLMTQKIYHKLLEAHGDNDVMVIRGIHESKEMEDGWNELTVRKEVRISLDLFEIGIILFKKGLQKEDFILKF